MSKATLRASFQKSSATYFGSLRAELRFWQTVHNGTERRMPRCYGWPMLRRKATRARKRPGDAIPASVKKEMVKPRMARSGRITELNLDTTRIREQPSTTMPGTVDKIIPSRHPSQPEKAQINVDRTDHRHRDLRIENTLTDEHGDDAKLKKGAHVQITVTAEPET
jgi:hypothetical protein